MKKITTILSALLLMIMFVSCSSDDNGSPERDFYLFINGLNLSDATKAMSLQVRDLNYLQVIYMPSDLGNRLANNQNLQIDLPEFKEVFESLEKQIIK